MAAQAPYEPQNHVEIKALVDILGEYAIEKSKKARFRITQRSFDLPTGRTVDRWKVGEFDYHKRNLPIYARGFFTYRTQDDNYEIAARGYNKFFNLGEGDLKTWDDVAFSTVGPYELSVKENGCIIFISGLDDGTLLVCSKHSTGATAATTASEMSHSVCGEKWVERHLRAAGKSKEGLATELRRMNATAVAELCDDAFEEHVLPYGGDRAGLYLHGLNLNLPEFVTYPGPLVDTFANQWGFKKVEYIVKDSLKDVETFLTNAAESGTFDGRDTEGFVIRCKKAMGRAGLCDFFFKFKFEEPYLLYRQWRELTKSAMNGSMPKMGKNKDITRKYLEYAMRRLDTEPNLREAYIKNQGVISLRQDFLDAHRLTGMDVVRQEQEAGAIEAANESNDGRKLAARVVIVPVATLGCGKTTLALALAKLFGWGHVQNDNVTAKKNRFDSFATQIRASFVDTNVTIADRNNHQMRERKQLFDEMPPYPGAYSFIGLHYLHPSSSRSSIFSDAQARIHARGDNHQTIHAASDPTKVASIMRGFLSRFEPVNTNTSPDSEFSLVVDLDPRVDSRVNLEVTITEMFKAYPSLFPNGIPKQEEMDNAIQWALHEYAPSVKMVLSGPLKEKKSNQNQVASASKAIPKASMEFFAVRVPTTDINNILVRTFNTAKASVRNVYDELIDRGRVQSEFHVTLIHRSAANSSDHSQYWKDLMEYHRTYWAQSVQSNKRSIEPELASNQVLVERVVWNNRLMCLVVRLLPDVKLAALPDSDEGAEGRAIEIKTVNRMAHITIGTVRADIKPRESNDLLARWLDEVPEPDGGKRWDIAMEGQVILDGSVRGVLSQYR